MANTPKYNWSVIRSAYVSGDMDLSGLAREKTRLNTDPCYATIKRYAAREGWGEQRKAYRYQLATATATQPSTQAVVEQTQAMIDACETIARHIRLAKSMQAIAWAKLKNINPADLTPRDALELIKVGTEIERKAMLLPEPRQEVDLNIDLTRLSDEEIETHRQILIKTLRNQRN